MEETQETGIRRNSVFFQESALSISATYTQYEQKFLCIGIDSPQDPWYGRKSPKVQLDTVVKSTGLAFPGTQILL